MKRAIRVAENRANPRPGNCPEYLGRGTSERVEVEPWTSSV